MGLYVAGMWGSLTGCKLACPGFTLSNLFVGVFVEFISFSCFFLSFSPASLAFYHTLLPLLQLNTLRCLPLSFIGLFFNCSSSLTGHDLMTKFDDMSVK